MRVTVVTAAGFVAFAAGGFMVGPVAGAMGVCRIFAVVVVLLVSRVMRVVRLHANGDGVS